MASYQSLWFHPEAVNTKGLWVKAENLCGGKFPSDNLVSSKQCSSKPIPLKQHCSQEGNQKDLIGKQILWGLFCLMRRYSENPEYWLSANYFPRFSNVIRERNGYDWIIIYFLLIFWWVAHSLSYSLSKPSTIKGLWLMAEPEGRWGFPSTIDICFCTEPTLHITIHCSHRAPLGAKPLSITVQKEIRRALLKTR